MKKSLVLLLLIVSTLVMTQKVNAITLSWEKNQCADYYIIYWGKKSGVYDFSKKTDTTKTTININESGTWFFAVKAFNRYGVSSYFSDEVHSYIKTKNECHVLQKNSNTTRR